MSKLSPIPAFPDGAIGALYQPADIWSHAQCAAPNWTPSGNLCLQIQVALDSWTGANAQVLASQWVPTAPSAGSWRLMMSTTGSLQLQTCPDGVSTSAALGSVTHAISLISLGSPANKAKLTIRVVRKSNDAGNTTTSFYVSTNYDPLAKTGTWNQVGTTQSTNGVSTIYKASQALLPPPIELGCGQLGSVNATGVLPSAGKFYWFNMFDGFDDTGNLIAMVDNRIPWSGYDNTPGYYTDNAAIPNRWVLQGPSARWVWDFPSTNTTTVQPSVPSTTKSGYGTLSFRPVSLSASNGGNMPGSTWKFMPVTMSATTKLLALTVESATAAAGGTAAMQFAIWNSDGPGGGPGSLLSNLANQGTLDMTIVGVQSLPIANGLYLQAGNYWVGCMWTGTASGGPAMYTGTGPHPAVVSTSTWARNTNCYTQATTTVPDPAAPNSTGAGVIVGFLQ